MRAQKNRLSAVYDIAQIQGWINTRLRTQPARRAMIDEYVFFACFGYWADYRPA